MNRRGGANASLLPSACPGFTAQPDAIFFQILKYKNDLRS
jgi:hypothetical protein